MKRAKYNVVVVGFHDFYTRNPEIKLYKLPFKKRFELYIDYNDLKGSLDRVKREYEKLIQRKRPSVEYIGAVGHPAYTIVALELAHKYNLQFCFISQDPATKEIQKIIPYTPAWEMEVIR